MTVSRLGRDAAEARRDDVVQRGCAQLERQCAGVDARQLEEVVDEHGQPANLVAERGEIVLGLGQPVLECLEHRLHVRERCPQVMAGPGDELAASIEQLLEIRSHLVERLREVGNLGWSRLGRPNGQITVRQSD